MDIIWVVLLVVVLVWLISVIRDVVHKRPITDEDRIKHIPLSYADLGKAAGCKSLQGMRPHMEDTYQAQYALNGDRSTAFFAVFDGHGGARTSQFAARLLHKMVVDRLKLLDPAVDALNSAFRQLDMEWLQLATKHNYDDGSTAVAALVIDNVLHVANVGDSRGVLACRGRAVDMSHDHKPMREDEKQRIVDLGGKVIHYGTWRVEGVLAVSRAFGDRRLKKYVTAVPEIESRTLTADDDYLILASDGVWDVLSSQEAVDIVMRADSASHAAAMLTDAAFHSGSADNITSLVVDLRKVVNK